MSVWKFARRFTTALLLLTFTTFSATAQILPSSPTPDQKPRKVKSEREKAFQNWIKEDVALIITPAEREAFEKLKTDEERERFIQDFWDHRDPDPDTEENEFKEEHFERIAYANEHFASGKPGWMTDRGRIYIKFGKPDEIESHPAGGQYQRMSYEGGGSTSTYPFERWFYRHISGVRSGVEIEFVDPTGSGEYRMARNFNEKDALLNVPGAGPTLGELDGTESRADRIAGTNYRREQDSPFAIAELHRDLEKAPELARNYFGRILTGRPIVDENALDFEIRADYFRRSDNRVLTAFTIQTDNKELVFQDSGGLQTARLNILGRVTTIADRRVGTFEDAVTTTATREELSDAKERKSAYAKAFILESGHYRLDVLVRDVVSGATGIRHFGFRVPAYEPDKLATSSIVLAAKLESMGDQPAAGRFVIGAVKVIPNLSGVFRRGQSLGLYLQVYNLGIDQTTLLPAAEVEYLLLRDGKQIGKQIEDWRDLNDSGQRLTLARLIPTQDLESGAYEIVVRIKDLVTGQTLSPSAKFTVQ
ncbi:MAG: GWxTD domain-containing protein [Pyrinomonadaceae bacterium]